MPHEERSQSEQAGKLAGTGKKIQLLKQEGESAKDQKKSHSSRETIAEKRSRMPVLVLTHLRYGYYKYFLLILCTYSDFWNGCPSQLYSMPSYWEQKRKEPRVSLRVPIKLSGTDSRGNSFLEETVTENVSHSGALVLIHHRISIGATVYLEIRNRFKSPATVQIVWMDANNPECFKAGIRFDGPVIDWIIK
jgi:hypothetical protein